MTEPLTVTTERVDDIPILLAQSETMGLPELLDEYFKPQLKVMLSALDPLGLPVVTQVVGGKAADDPLYLPAIKQVSQSLPEHGVLYVGDCKMAALTTRAYVQAQGDYYLCPLAQTQLPPRGVGQVSAAGVERQAALDSRASGQDGGARRSDRSGF